MHLAVLGFLSPNAHLCTQRQSPERLEEVAHSLIFTAFEMRLMQAAEHRYFSHWGWLTAPALATSRLLTKPERSCHWPYRRCIKRLWLLAARRSRFKGRIAYSAAWQCSSSWELQPVRQEGEVSIALLEMLLMFMLSFLFFCAQGEWGKQLFYLLLLDIPKPGYGWLD